MSNPQGSRIPLTPEDETNNPTGGNFGIKEPARDAVGYLYIS